MPAVRELREFRERVHKATKVLSDDAALATIDDAIRDRTDLRSAEEAFGTVLGADGWRTVAAEVESSRFLEQRIRAFAGVQSKDAGSLEASLRVLQHRERERLGLIQLRNDVLGAAAAAAVDEEAANEKNLKTEAGEPNRASIKVVRELIESAEGVKSAMKAATLADAIDSLRHTPNVAQQELDVARRRLRRLHSQLLSASAALPATIQRWATADSGSARGEVGPHGTAERGSLSNRSDDRAGPHAAAAAAAPEQSERGRGERASSGRSADGQGGSTGRSVPSAAPSAADSGPADAGAPSADEPLLSSRSCEGASDDEAGEADDHDGADGTDGNDDESHGQRAWRRTGAAQAVISNADAANQSVPKLPLAASAPSTATAPSAAEPATGKDEQRTSSRASSSRGAATARPASPRRGAGSTNGSPRGSPQARTGSSTSREPRASKRRPPQPAPSAAFAPAPTSSGDDGRGGMTLSSAAVASSASLVGGISLAVDYAPSGLMGVGSTSLVHAARRLAGGRRRASCGASAACLRPAFALPSPRRCPIGCAPRRCAHPPARPPARLPACPGAPPTRASCGLQTARCTR